MGGAEYTVEMAGITASSTSCTSPQESLIHPFSLLTGCKESKCCNSCNTLNMHDANWCIECGVSLLSTGSTEKLQLAEVERVAQSHSSKN